MDVNRIIDNYLVETVDGRKVIHYNGFTWPNEHGIEYELGTPEYLADEMTFCYVPVGEYSRERLASEMELVKQYQYPLYDEGAVRNYLCGEPGTHLPLHEVSEDTPCGFYWCYYEEE